MNNNDKQIKINKLIDFIKNNEKWSKIYSKQDIIDHYDMIVVTDSALMHDYRQSIRYESSHLHKRIKYLSNDPNLQGEIQEEFNKTRRLLKEAYAERDTLLLQFKKEIEKKNKIIEQLIDNGKYDTFLTIDLQHLNSNTRSNISIEYIKYKKLMPNCPNVISIQIYFENVWIKNQGKKYMDDKALWIQKHCLKDRGCVL